MSVGSDDELAASPRCLKLLLLGETGVGKSALVRRFSDGTFNQSFIATVG